MPTLSDILLGKLALREELVSTAALMECMAKQHQSPDSSLGELLVQRRLISTASLSDLQKAASKAQLSCGTCSRTYRPDQLGNAAGLVCECGAELTILLNGEPTSDRVATGPTRRFETVVLDEDPSLDEAPVVKKPPKPTRREFGRLGKTFTGQFGAYEIVSELGRGGMGVVYKARQPRLNRFVALKILLAGPLASRTQTERFRKEAEITARLRHPGIVQIHDVGKVGEHDYFTMDFVEGTPLNMLIRRRQVPIRRAVEIAREVAEALHHAHQRGAVHRDVKPANLIINGKGSPVLTDFGLARDMDEDEAHRLTNSGSVVGTPYYMAPEQARGERDQISGWTDVYALGVVLYECLTYRVPFRAKTHLELTKKILHEQPQPPSQIEPAIELELEGIVLKAMAKSPAERYPTAEAMAQDLANFLEGRPTSVGATKGQRVIREIRRRSAWISGAVIGLVLVLGGVWAVAASLSQTSDDPPPPVGPDDPDPPPEPEDQVAQGVAIEAFAAFRSARQASERSGAYQEALERAETRATEALSLAEDRADLWVLRGRVYAAMNREQEALEDLQRAIELDPEGPAGAEAGYLIAELHQANDRVQDGRVAIRAALDRTKEPGPWGPLLRGRMSLLDGDYDAALELGQQAAAENPELYEASMLQGTALLFLGRESDARTAYERATRLNDKSASAWNNLGSLALSLGETSRGIEALSRALGLRPELRSARWARAMAYRDQGDYSEALGDLRALERLDKDSVDVLCQLALLYMRSHADRAQEAADRALKLAPRDPQVYVTRTRLLLQRFQTREALAELRRGLEAVPSEHPEWDELERYFLVLSLTSQQTESLAAYLDGQEPVPEARRARNAVQRALLASLDDPEASRADLRKACLAAPSYSYGWRCLLNSSSNPDAIRAEVERMLAAGPKDGEFYGYAARVYFSLGDTKDGERALAKGLEIDPQSPALLVTRASVSGDPNEVARLLSGPIADYPLRHIYLLLFAERMHEADPALAERSYVEALGLVPFELPGVLGYVRLLFEQKRPDEVLGLLSRQRELYEAVERELPSVLLPVATHAYLAKGDRDEALRSVNEAAARSKGTPTEPSLRVFRASVLQQLGEQEELRDEVERLAVDFPDHPEVQKLLEAIRR